MAEKTQRLAARITPETEAQIDVLARIWGPVVPLSQSDVAARAVHLAWEAEKKKAKKSNRAH